MSVRVKLDERLHQVWITVLPEPQTTTIAETVIRLVEERPVLGSWDWVLDTRNPHQLTPPEEMDRIAAMFNAVRTGQGHTIFISLEAAAYDRCAILGRKFLGRRHLVARSPEEARRLLPEPMPII